MLATLAVLVSLSAAPPLLAQAGGGGEVDVELVLAVDVSRSMDYEEVRIQRQGYVEALQHPDFINAVRGGLLGRVAIAYFEWAGTVDASSVIEWAVVETSEDANAFAAQIAERPIQTKRRTSISAAIAEGASMIVSNRFQGMRQVIDVSGDGPNNVGQPVVPARDRAVEAGIVINGLAIMIRPSGAFVPLDEYYGNCVIGGPGAFVLPVHDIKDFAVAVRRKLVMEISGISPSPDYKRIDYSEADCLVGERQWQNFLDR
nr:hypothetical protein REQ54_03418 [Rhizobium sp. Q54]